MDNKKSLLVIFLIVFFDLLAFGIVIPILPYYTKSFGSDAFGWSWVMAIYSIMQFLMAPVWGSLSDRYGRKPILLISLLGMGASTLVMAYAASFWSIFFCRLVTGFFAANISTAAAYIADSTTEENRAKGMGIIGAGFGLGFVFGPAIGGLLAPYGYSVPLLLAGVLILCNTIFAFFVLEETVLYSQERRKNRSHFSFALIKKALGLKKTSLPIVLFFLNTLAFSQLEMSFAFFVSERYLYDAKSAGLLLAMMGTVMALIQGGAIGKLSRKFGEQKLITAGFILLILGMVGSGFVTDISFFVFFLLLLSVGQSVTNPSLMSIMSKAAPPGHSGAYMGIYQSGGSLARILGPPIAGYLFIRLGISWPLYTSGLIVALALLIAVCSVDSKAKTY